MRTDPRPGEIRGLVRRLFRQFGEVVPLGGDLKETILIDGGRYVARSYRADHHFAMWLVEIGVVQFYNADGDMLTTVNLFESVRGQRMAA